MPDVVWVQCEKHRATAPQMERNELEAEDVAFALRAFHAAHRDIHALSGFKLYVSRVHRAVRAEFQAEKNSKTGLH